MKWSFYPLREWVVRVVASPHQALRSGAIGGGWPTPTTPWNWWTTPSKIEGVGGHALERLGWPMTTKPLGWPNTSLKGDRVVILP